jgi:hypothetical protein
MEEAGVSPRADAPFDGMNLIPYLSGKMSGAPHTHLFWRVHPTLFGARVNGLKLVRPGGKSSSPELYDLATDIGENDDLARSRPEDVQALRTAARQWASQMSKTLRFPGLGATSYGPGPFGNFDPATQQD